MEKSTSSRMSTTVQSLASTAALGSDIETRRSALGRMKLIATGVFVGMAALFIVTEHVGTGAGWIGYVNAFAEAAMVGALADWFAVVALFRHPLGLPIWHTAIIPRKKEEIGRNLASFVDTRLLSVENVSRELDRFSGSSTLLGFLGDPVNRERAAGWLAEGVGTVVHTLDSEQVEGALADAIAGRIHTLDASALLGRALGTVVEDGRHQQLIDSVLRQVGEWLPSRRDTVQEFIERATERTLKWGSKLIPKVVINHATDQTLTALIEVVTAAANDPSHPLRADLDARVREWVEKLCDDPEWKERINGWKEEMLQHPKVRGAIADLWTSLKEWIASDLDAEHSTLRTQARRAIDALYNRLAGDTELQRSIDERLRSTALMLLERNQGAIGSIIQRVVDAWDGRRLSEELELAIGRDLQYIRLNGTFIGGTVGLLIHLLR